MRQQQKKKREKETIWFVERITLLQLMLHSILHYFFLFDARAICDTREQWRQPQLIRINDERGQKNMEERIGNEATTLSRFAGE